MIFQKKGKCRHCGHDHGDGTIKFAANAQGINISQSGIKFHAILEIMNKLDSGVIDEDDVIVAINDVLAG